MASEREVFDLSGPLYLTSVDWKNEHHRRSVAASLVQGVYILERDCQERREGLQALAPIWWEFFNFQLHCVLKDEDDIFGAVYEFKCPVADFSAMVEGCPHYVVAFRGTITKGESFSRDLKLNFDIIQNGLHQASRSEIAVQAVRNLVAIGNRNIWLAGHSLGAAMAMVAGKNLAKTGIFLDAFLFNPPFVSTPIERIKDKKVKHGIRIAGSFVTAALALAVKGNGQRNRSQDPFVVLSSWVPHLYVNPGDHICSEYIGYFEHRKKMEEIGAGDVERLATQHSLGSLVLNAFGRSDSEPLHLIPSAYLTVNLSPSPNFKESHGIHQWWKPDLLLKSRLHKYT
ncbi:Fungal lipase-like domain [Dillenia turbinata]|uniref:Fungal lipase-like domain n=1 Tax=Dillenia turbinata TaxID=194707 RepID=A0AAN8WKM8_9MAGN